MPHILRAPPTYLISFYLRSAAPTPYPRVRFIHSSTQAYPGRAAARGARRVHESSGSGMSPALAAALAAGEGLVGGGTDSALGTYILKKKKTGEIILSRHEDLLDDRQAVSYDSVITGLYLDENLNIQAYEATLPERRRGSRPLPPSWSAPLPRHQQLLCAPCPADRPLLQNQQPRAPPSGASEGSQGSCSSSKQPSTTPPELGLNLWRSSKKPDRRRTGVSYGQVIQSDTRTAGWIISTGMTSE